MSSPSNLDALIERACDLLGRPTLADRWQPEFKDDASIESEKPDPFALGLEEIAASLERHGLTVERFSAPARAVVDRCATVRPLVGLDWQGELILLTRVAGPCVS